MAPLSRLESALTAAVAATLRGHTHDVDAAAGQRREGSAVRAGWKEFHAEYGDRRGTRSMHAPVYHKTAYYFPELYNLLIRNFCFREPRAPL